MNDLETLRTWRTAAPNRALVTSADGSVKLIQFKDYERWESHFASAAEAVEALANNSVHWIQRSQMKSSIEPMRQKMQGWCSQQPRARRLTKQQRIDAKRYADRIKRARRNAAAGCATY